MISEAVLRREPGLEKSGLALTKKNGAWRLEGRPPLVKTRVEKRPWAATRKSPVRMRGANALRSHPAAGSGFLAQARANTLPKQGLLLLRASLVTSTSVKNPAFLLG